MAAKILVSCLLVSSAVAAPQTLFAAPAAVGAHASHVVRSPFGTSSAHANHVTDGTSTVHRHDSRHEGARGVVRVARPQFISAGPFAVQAFPDQTPFVVGDASGAQVITAARGLPAPSTNLFQTADGRIFAFSNGNEQIQPGQIFQTPDGRIFTTAVINQAAQQPSQIESSQANNVIQAVRDANNDAQEQVEEEVATEDLQPQISQQQQIRQQQLQQRQQLREQLQTFAAVPSSQAFVRAPLIDHANHFEAVQTQSPGHFIHASPTFVRAAAAPVATPIGVRAAAAPAVVAPIGFSLADTAATGYFTFPGAGVAFNF